MRALMFHAPRLGLPCAVTAMLLADVAQVQRHRLIVSINSTLA
jgi:hypothetical protein